MGRVAGVFDNPPGFPCKPPGVDILEGGKLTSNNVAGSSHDPLQSPAVASGAVSKPGGDTAGQDPSPGCSPSLASLYLFEQCLRLGVIGTSSVCLPLQD